MRDLKSMNKLYNVVFSRIFHTTDYEVIAVIRDFCKLPDIADMLTNSHKKFVAGFFKKKFTFSAMIYSINRTSC